MINKIKTTTLVILTLGLVLLLHHCNKPKVVHSFPNVLKPTEKEKIFVNSQKHTITIVSNKGTTTTEYGRNPVIIEDYKGNLLVDRHSWGFEHSPFVGFAMHDRPRVHLGISLFYLNKFDVNASLALTTNSSYSPSDWIRGSLSLSYNVYSNTSLFVGIDTHKYPCAGIFLRW